MNGWILSERILFCQRRSMSPAVARPVRLALWVMLVVAFAANGQAQVTVEALTGAALVDATKGAHYLDVQDAIKKFQSGDIEGARALLESAKEKTPALSPPSIMMAQLF